MVKRMDVERVASAERGSMSSRDSELAEERRKDKTERLNKTDRPPFPGI